MPEKVSEKIKRLQAQLSNEMGRSIDLHATIRSQGELIDQFVLYFIKMGLSDDRAHAIQTVRDYSSLKDDENQLSFDLE